MKQARRVFQAVMFCILFISVLSGCVSVPDSPAPRFYTLRAEENQAAPKFHISPGIIIAVGPVEIPECHDRPQIVTQNKDKTLSFAQFDRWGEPLEPALTGLLNEYLTGMLAGAAIQNYPWNLAIPVKYQVAVDVLQLESELDKDMFIAAQWTVIDAERKKMVFIKRSEFRRPIEPHNYAGVARALSSACAGLSAEIAEKLSSLAAASN